MDINKCEFKLSEDEPVHVGWPTQITLIIRDQYGDLVLVPNIKVEMYASPSDNGVGNGSRKSKRFSSMEHLQNNLVEVPKVPYEPTVKDKVCYKAITFMKTYEDFSFEELRYVDPGRSMSSESMAAVDNCNGTFAINWTPATAGLFCLTIIIDGFAMEDVYRVHVKDTGVPPPPEKMTEKNVCVPNKLRQFVAKYSAGLRIRTHPTLQSTQLGIVKMNGIISFIDEVVNDDGKWVRLSTESIRQHVVTTWFPTEAWCLQFNSHLDRTLLFPVNDPVHDYGEEDATEEVHNQTRPVDEVVLVQPDHSQQTKNPFLNVHIKQEEPMVKPVVSEEMETNTTEGECRSKSIEGGTPSNLGNTIAGVVEEGANKIQALHKWLKGDSVDFRAGIRKRLESTGDAAGSDWENRASGELPETATVAPPSVPLPLTVQHPKLDYPEKRNTFLISGMPMVAETSKQSRRTKLSNLTRTVPRQLSTETTSTIGSRAGSFEEQSPPLMKQALPPSLAESLRAMFAAFLWQEDIVHDAMACASFLKFHPLLPKNLGHVSDGHPQQDFVDTRTMTK